MRIKGLFSTYLLGCTKFQTFFVQFVLHTFKLERFVKELFQSNKSMKGLSLDRTMKES